jgi:hypothetical protein
MRKPNSMTRPHLSLLSPFLLPPTKLTLTISSSLRRSLTPILQLLNPVSTLHLQRNNSKFLVRNLYLPQRSPSPILPPVLLSHSHPQSRRLPLPKTQQIQRPRYHHLA